MKVWGGVAYREGLIDSTERGLQSSTGKEISTAIPTDITNAVELICNSRNSCTNDGLVECDEENSEV
jgi:hypothetical protein